jgi:hypothetical protein
MHDGPQGDSPLALRGLFYRKSNFSAKTDLKNIYQLDGIALGHGRRTHDHHFRADFQKLGTRNSTNRVLTKTINYRKNAFRRNPYRRIVKASSQDIGSKQGEVKP